jgi:rod shape-determining protein MreC
MRNLLRFIINNQFIFLFLLIEILSLSLVVQSNKYQQAKYINAAQDLTGYLSQKKSKILQYLYLKEMNLQLVSENQTLKNELEYYKHNNIAKPVIVEDTVHKQHYSYIISKVVNNTVNKQYNFITLDKGSADGVKPEMAVISSNGVVGIVESTTENYSLIISVLNRNLKVSAKLKKNNYFGSFEWPGINYRNGILNEIPLHVNINEGDTLVTSGFSAIFPEGILLGYVTDFTDRGGNFFKITLQLSNDFKNLNYVYIVTDYRKLEQQTLESLSKHD